MMMSQYDADGSSTIRAAAVAGTFYPANADSLRDEIMSYLSGSSSLPSYPRLLISPHAGYVFSGPVAGKGFATIDKKVNRVFLLGPSHHQYFEGIVLTNAEYYQTPLGKVKVDTTAVAKLRKNPMVVTALEAEMPEHCIEVQLSFLQVQLKDFTIIPILVGKADTKKIAELLYPLIDSSTLVIASSDLSHYHEQHQARKIDDASIANILNGQVNGTIDGCGEKPIRVIMTLAEMLGLSPIKIDSRTSFETAPQYGSASRVVGYASIAYVPKNIEVKVTSADTVTDESKDYLLKLARQSLVAAVGRTTLPLPIEVPTTLHKNRGCFVTLTIDGNLRGCIGYIEPIMPLCKAVIENAKNAALSDPRFSPVTMPEINKIKIELSVLTSPKELPYSDCNDLLCKIRPNVDGVILQKGYYQSTFLPQVWEQIPDKIKFLQHLALKAGLQSDEWKEAQFKVYQVQHFEE